MLYQTPGFGEWRPRANSFAGAKELCYGCSHLFAIVVRLVSTTSVTAEQ